MIYCNFSLLNAKSSADVLNTILKNKSEWAYQWKMLFNPDLNKQAQKVIFLRKMTKSFHSQICLNNAIICTNLSG